MKKIFLILIMFFIVVAIYIAQEEPIINKVFNSIEWKVKGSEWVLTNKRKSMLNDLVKNRLKLGQKKKTVLNLLGAPSVEQNNTLQYIIKEKYDSNIDPEYIEILFIVFNNENKIIEVKTLKEE